MPTTHLSEAALDRRREKFQYVAEFPGLLPTWSEARGRTVAQVVSVGEAQVLVFTDGCFLVALPSPLAGEAALKVLLGAREALASHWAAEFAELDRRIAAEREAMRLARMEKVLGAVEQNLPQVPELRQELLQLLERLP